MYVIYVRNKTGWMLRIQLLFKISRTNLCESRGHNFTEFWKISGQNLQPKKIFSLLLNLFNISFLSCFVLMYVKSFGDLLPFC